MTSRPSVRRLRLPLGPSRTFGVPGGTGVLVHGVAAAGAAAGTDAPRDPGETQSRLRRRHPEDAPGRWTRGPRTGGPVR